MLILRDIPVIRHRAVVKFRLDRANLELVRNVELRMTDQLTRLFFCVIHLGDEWEYTSLYINDPEFVELIQEELREEFRTRSPIALKSAFFNLLQKEYFEQPFELQLREKSGRPSYFTLKRESSFPNEDIKLFSVWNKKLVRELSISDPEYKYETSAALFLITNEKNPAILEHKYSKNGWRYYIHIDSEAVYIRRQAEEQKAWVS